VARDKNDKAALLETLRDPAFWIVWIDDDDKIHHTLRSLAAVMPPEARVAKFQQKG
jgi:hypothetical protein|tara:strand:- start:290 stop:457 length:168 start_codon:yes stop_codon:yes gene_type:complete